MFGSYCIVKKRRNNFAAVREEFCGLLCHANIEWLGVFEAGEPLTYEDRSHCVLWDILKGLAFLHVRGIAHRDITPANIVRVGETYKLVNFGLARILPYATQSQTSETSVPWSAVELLEGGMTDVRCDVWSLGVVCLTLYRGSVIFCGSCKDVVEQWRDLKFDYHEKIYSKMICDLKSRWTSFKLCRQLGLPLPVLAVPKMTEVVHNIYGDKSKTFLL